MPGDARILSLVDAQAAARRRAERRAMSLIRRLLLLMLGRWYSEPAVAEFRREVASVVAEAQQVVAESTGQFLDDVLELMGAVPPRARMQVISDFRRVDPLIEWNRPAVQFRWAQSQGADEEQAQRAAIERAEILLEDDVQLAQQLATVTRLADYGGGDFRVIGYRRILHPELSTSGTCGLCATASHRMYYVDRLMPVHGRCKCGVLPVTATWDPGQGINDDDLARLYEEAGSTAGAALKRVRLRVEEHSELGPRLVAA